MSDLQTGAERMPHGLSHLGFLAGQIGRLITISTTPVIAGDSFEMDAVGALRLSPLRRGLAIDSTVDIFTFYVPHRHVYGEQWIKFIDSSEISESVNFCVMEAIKLCRLDTPIIFIEARINLSRFVVTGCAAKTSATVTFPSLNLISLFAFCFNIWLNGVAS